MIEGDCLMAHFIRYDPVWATWASPAVSSHSQRQPGQKTLLRPSVRNACREADLDNRPDGKTAGGAGLLYRAMSNLPSWMPAQLDSSS